ncbi:hypothetical protein [Chryseosolibacter indicus]|uniref:Uncharacterized protein n=1 Tax=Chryseosolibacter indicus TaxID=2782351 RepID=A0ABS5VYS6_9BACT|nr:hypothetical protein [Chryseosolibacter indicus]MBT1706558.1 hypothetical protein [Chryseosolibacter indicus]
MRYYKIGKAWEPEIIGVKDGLAQADLIEEKTDDYREIKDFFYGQTYWDRKDFLPTKEFIFKYIKLRKNAKVTDLLSFAPHLLGIDFVLSSKVKRLLNGLDLNNNHFFATNLFDFNGHVIHEQYFVLYTIYFGFETVNFKKSVFFSGDDQLGHKQYHNFETWRNWEDYWDRPDHEFVKAEKIVIAEKHPGDYIKTRLGGPFISERLLDRWTSFGISGFVQLNDQTIEFE